MRCFLSEAGRRAATFAAVAGGSLVAALLWFGLGQAFGLAPGPDPLLEAAHPAKPARALEQHRTRAALGYLEPLSLELP